MSTQLESLRRYVASRPLPTPQPSSERVLLVGSGKGGVGTSTVAALLSVMAAADGQDVLLVDADESHGALPLLLGTDPERSVRHLRGGEVAPADLLVPIGHGLTLLPLGGTGNPDERLSASERRGIVRRVASLYGRFDLVIIDTGSRLEQVANAVAAGASRLLAVTAAERISAAATYALVKTIDARAPGLPIDLLFNRCRLSAANQGFDEIARATRQFLGRGVAFAGAVPEDDRLREALAEGTPLLDVVALGTPAATASHEMIVALAHQIDQGQSVPAGRVLDYSPAVSAPRLSPRR